MLEIIILYKLCSNIGATVERLGRQKIGYQLLLIAFWFGGEFSGGLVAAIISAIIAGGEPNMLLVYLTALLGAVVGAFLCFFLVKNLPSLKEEWKEDAFDEDELFRRRMRKLRKQRRAEQAESQEQPDTRFEE